MAAGTVAYQDTRGNKDYLGIIANQIGRRLKEASDMASDERAFAEKKAEEGGTSLDEAGIGKGYFFKRALGSRFGGDRIARTRGRMGATGAGTSPTGNFKTRFRGGFDYNVTNEIQSATVPLSSALVGGLRGVETGLSQVSSALSTMGSGISDLAQGQSDMARATYMNGQVLRVIVTEIKRQQARLAGRREERSIEGGGFRGSGGGPGGGRRMINVTPQGGGGGGSRNPFGLSATDALNFASGQGLRKASKGATAPKALKAAQSGAKAKIGKAFTGARTLAQNATKFVPNVSKITQNISKIFKIRPTQVKTAITPVKTAAAATKATRVTLAGGQATAGLNALLKDPDFIAGMGSGPASKALADEMMALQGLGSDEAIIKKFAEYGGDIGADGVTMTVRATPLGESAKLAKNLSPEDAAKIAPYRLASADDAGMKVADMAADQLIKKGTKQGLKRGNTLARMMVKQFGSAGTKSILKKIPIVAGLAGVAFGIQRALEGDFLGAGLEITSGLLGATGVGGGLGLGIDGFLLARDIGMMPMAKGGLLTGKRPVNALMGEAGPEIVTPLNDDTFIKFGEGVLNAQKQNKTDYAKVQAEGLKQYYEGMGGWNSFGSAFTGIFDTLKDIISNIRIPNPFNFGRNNNNNGGNRPGVTAGSDTLDIGAGGGELTGLSKEDYIQIAKTIAGEAGPGDDQYLVAAAILNRVASSKFPNNVTDVVQAGQYDGGPVQFEGYKANANVDDIVKRLLSPEGQARLVEALNRMEGRTDFKGQALLKNRVAAEDPMFDKKGNYGHYWWQKGPNSTMPSDYVVPNYQQFIKSTNAADQQASILNTNSALTGANGLSFMTPTVINNYYTNNSSGAGDGGSEFFGPAFGSTDLNAFTLRYSLAAK